MQVLDNYIKELEKSMEKTFAYFLKEFSGLRTGKASPNLVEELQVEAYGGFSRLKDVAGIAAPEPRMLIVQPWDVSIIDSIVKAISKANIGITPVKDGKIIRLPIPELSQERRNEMKKLAKKIAEENRVAVRTLRRDANEKIKKMQKDSQITEDLKSQGEKKVQDLTDKTIQKIDHALKDKENELDKI